MSNFFKIFLFSLFAVIPLTSSAEGDFLVTPAQKELYVRPGGETSFELSLVNRTSNTLDLSLHVEDMQNQENRLAPYISLDSTDFSVGVGETARISVRIKLPLSQLPQGLYGGVVISTRPAVSDGAGAKLVSRIRVPVLVRTIESPSVTGALTKFDVRNGGFSPGPVKTTIGYLNGGDVHIQPRGRLILTNIFGQKSGETVVSPWFILPGNESEREVSVGSRYLFGYYSATLIINEGFEKNIEVVTRGVLILPWQGIIIILALIIIVFTVKRILKNFEFRIKNSA